MANQCKVMMAKRFCRYAGTVITEWRRQTDIGKVIKIWQIRRQRRAGRLVWQGLMENAISEKRDRVLTARATAFHTFTLGRKVIVALKK